MAAVLNLYVWDTDIGQMVANAVDVAAARKQVLSLLSPKDAAFEELRQALSVEPKVVTHQPVAVIAWHH